MQPDQLADIVAAVMKTTTASMLARITSLESRPAPDLSGLAKDVTQTVAQAVKAAEMEFVARFSTSLLTHAMEAGIAIGHPPSPEALTQRKTITYERLDGVMRPVDITTTKGGAQ